METFYPYSKLHHRLCRKNRLISKICWVLNNVTTGWLRPFICCIFWTNSFVFVISSTAITRSTALEFGRSFLFKLNLKFLSYFSSRCFSKSSSVLWFMYFSTSFTEQLLCCSFSLVDTAFLVLIWILCSHYYKYWKCADQLAQILIDPALTD